MTHEEDRFDHELQRLARELDAAPEVPREAIWARIDAARRPQRVAHPHRAAHPAHGGVFPMAPRRRLQPAFVRWALPLAAMLVLGVALGRMTLLRQGGSGVSPVATQRSAAAADSAAMLPYRLAALQHLVKMEALLTALPMDARTGQLSEVSGWAGDLLTDTRLLLDSPAGRDAELKKLLEDLELVLAQIASLQPAGAEGEVEIIQDGMNQRDVLLRLRAATARPNLAGS